LVLFVGIRISDIRDQISGGGKQVISDREESGEWLVTSGKGRKKIHHRGNRGAAEGAEKRPQE